MAGETPFFSSSDDIVGNWGCGGFEFRYDVGRTSNALGGESRKIEEYPGLILELLMLSEEGQSRDIATRR